MQTSHDSSDGPELAMHIYLNAGAGALLHLSVVPVAEARSILCDVGDL